MSRQAILWQPRTRLQNGVLELWRSDGDRFFEISPGMSPRRVAIRCGMVKSLACDEPDPGFETAPCVTIATDDLTVNVIFTPYGRHDQFSAEELERQRQEGRPQCREFYAQLVREMNRDGA